jgi:transposase
MKNALREAGRDANAYRRGESIGVDNRRHRWPEAERSRIVAESLEPDAKVSEAARRNGVNRGVLSTWRKEASKLMGEAGMPAFAPVIVEGYGILARSFVQRRCEARKRPSLAGEHDRD